MSLANHFHSDTISPNLKLVNGGCTKGISCDKEGSLPRLCHPLCNFGDGGCFAYAVDSDDEGGKWFRAFIDQLIDCRT